VAISFIADGEVNMVALIRSTQEFVESGFVAVGKGVDKVRYDYLPECARYVSQFALTLLKSYYFVLPGVAIALGHYGDAVAAGSVCIVSLADWFLRDPDCRQASALMIGVPVTIALLLQIESVALVSIAFKTISLAKLVLIARGENY